MNNTKNEAYLVAKTELAEAQRDKIRYKLAVEQGKYILREEVEKQQAEEIARVKTKLLSLPAKLTPQITGLTDRAAVHDLLAGAIDETLHELSQPRVTE